MRRDSRPLIIGLTGNIGSGKSLAAKWFTERGYPVISTDILGHEALLKPFVIEQLTKVFGTGILNEDGTVHRRKLGECVFGDQQKLDQLSQIVHPEIRKELQARIDQMNDDVVIVEIPLLFESKLDPCVDFILLVIADEDIRLRRIIERDRLDEEAVKNRIRSQTNIDKKNKIADLTIDNSNSLEDFFERLSGFETNICSLKKRGVIRFDER